jgi:hypothetical protein
VPNFSRRPFRRTPKGDDDCSAIADDGDKPLRRLRQFLSRRETQLAGILLLLVIIGLGAWLVVGALDAKSNLEQARNSAQQAKDALLQADTGEASKWADEAQSHAQAARGATHSLPWNIASVMPWLGSPFKTGQQISDVVAGLAADVLEPSVHVGQALSPDHLFAGNGHVDVQLLRDSAAKLSEISTAATTLDAQARAISEPKYLTAMRDARAALQAQTSDLSGLLDHTALAARLAPSMMGADAPAATSWGFRRTLKPAAPVVYSADLEFFDSTTVLQPWRSWDQTPS